MTVKCNSCGYEMSADESYQYLGKTLYEDCYIDMRYPLKACDPWAVYLATRSRVSQALDGEDGNVFFLLRAKCPVLTELLGVQVGDAVLKQNQHEVTANKYRI